MVDFLPKLKIEIATPSDQVDTIVATIVETASNNKVGDGKIFIHALEKVIRIRTGETDQDAI